MSNQWEIEQTSGLNQFEEVVYSLIWSEERYKPSGRKLVRELIQASSKAYGLRRSEINVLPLKNGSNIHPFQSFV